VRIKAIFLDFYGTLVHEDDEIIHMICNKIKDNATEEYEVRDIGRYWWKTYSRMSQTSYGESFKTQRELGILSLAETITNFNSNCSAEELIQKQFVHWSNPIIYEDTIPFLQDLKNYKVYILSNIDSVDLKAAVSSHCIQVHDIITSEDVKSYKPRSEMFVEVLNRYNLGTDEVLHIGDSITSDVAGAGKLGIKTIWLNRLNKVKPEGIQPNFECKDLTDVRTILSGIEEGSIVV